MRSELYLLSIFEDERDIIEACIAFKKKSLNSHPAFKTQFGGTDFL